MKKILFVINTLGRAGAETALLELCAAWMRRNMKFHFTYFWGRVK